MGSMVKSEYSKKWITAFIVIVSGIVGYVLISFFGQLGEWFDLESKIPHFLFLVQGAGLLLGVACFFILYSRDKYVHYLNEVYGELVKVIWPSKDSMVKLTVGIIIALSIVSSILLLIDFIFRKLLSLIIAF